MLLYTVLCFVFIWLILCRLRTVYGFHTILRFVFVRLILRSHTIDSLDAVLREIVPESAIRNSRCPHA